MPSVCALSVPFVAHSVFFFKRLLLPVGFESSVSAKFVRPIDYSVNKF